MRGADINLFRPAGSRTVPGSIYATYSFVTTNTPPAAARHTWHHSDKQLFDMSKIGPAALCPAIRATGRARRRQCRALTATPRWSGNTATGWWRRTRRPPPRPSKERRSERRHDPGLHPAPDQQRAATCKRAPRRSGSGRTCRSSRSRQRPRRQSRRPINSGGTASTTS
jgi:hypothetical protein